MHSHEFKDLWKEIRKQNKAKSALSNFVAGVTGETDMWACGVIIISGVVGGNAWERRSHVRNKMGTAFPQEKF